MGRRRGTGAGRRGLRLLAGLAAAAALVGAGAAPAGADEWTIRTGLHVDAWSTSAGPSQDGHEILVPLGLFYDAPNWGASVRGTYGSSERDPGGGVATASITGLLDTTLSGYYRLSLGELELRAGLDLDLPTGVSRLKLRQFPAVQDKDLVTVERFGEGFDANPTLTAYRSFGAWGLGGGVGYLWTGKYDPTSEIPADDLDRGDELTAVALADVFVADMVRVTARVGYTYFTADERGGAEVFKEHDELDMAVTAEWAPEPWWLAVTLRDIVRLKAERPGGGSGLTTEAQNSAGNEIRANVTTGYIFNDTWSGWIALDLRHVAANDYPSSSVLHDGGRTKVAFGPGVKWSLGRALAVDASLRYFHLDAKQSPVFPKDTTIHGVHADLRVTYRF